MLVLDLYITQQKPFQLQPDKNKQYSNITYLQMDRALVLHAHDDLANISLEFFGKMLIRLKVVKEFNVSLTVYQLKISFEIVITPHLIVLTPHH